SGQISIFPIPTGMYYSLLALAPAPNGDMWFSYTKLGVFYSSQYSVSYNDIYPALGFVSSDGTVHEAFSFPQLGDTWPLDYGVDYFPQIYNIGLRAFPYGQHSMTFGPDGALWFAASTDFTWSFTPSPYLIRVTEAGNYTVFPIPTEHGQS